MSEELREDVASKLRVVGSDTNEMEGAESEAGEGDEIEEEEEEEDGPEEDDGDGTGSETRWESTSPNCKFFPAGPNG
jgi:hypothetical protein